MTTEPARSDFGTPTKGVLHNPILNAMRTLGGSATSPEIEAQIISALSLREDVLEDTTPSGQSRLRTRLSWARFELMTCGYLEQASESNGYYVWALTKLGRETLEVDSAKIVREANRIVRERKAAEPPVETESEIEEADPDGDTLWREQLRGILLSMSPGDFERLCQLMLRRSGFSEVTVTGRSGDGGIDGHGTLRVAGLISFLVSFQCKRYKGSVGSPVVREFRGSLGRRTERGLLITTGTFTQDAIREASREGAVPIDLLDGDALLERLRELRIGITVQQVEETSVDYGWWERNYGITDTPDAGA